jgi:hypothetical protein
MPKMELFQVQLTPRTCGEITSSVRGTRAYLAIWYGEFIMMHLFWADKLIKTVDLHPFISIKVGKVDY